MATISSNLRMQYDKIQNDYIILTIWASVLMIIFLIFSIYSMFKIDEIQKQSRESLKQIDETFYQVRFKSDNLDELMRGAMTRIEGIVLQKTDEFTKNIKSKSQDLETQIEEYKQTVTRTADSNQQLFNAFSLLLKGSSPQASSLPEKAADKNKKQKNKK